MDKSATPKTLLDMFLEKHSSKHSSTKSWKLSSRFMIQQHQPNVKTRNEQVLALLKNNSIPLKRKPAVNHLKIEQLTFENDLKMATLQKKTNIYHMPPWEKGTSSTRKCWLLGDMSVSWRVGSQVGWSLLG